MYPSRLHAWHQALLVTHHQQMSSLALGHLQLWASDEINDSLLAPRHRKPYATGWTGSHGQGRDKNLLWGEGGEEGEGRARWFTCPGWRWRSWLFWPSRIVWLPIRWRGCSAAQRHPEGRHSYVETRARTIEQSSCTVNTHLLLVVFAGHVQNNHPVTERAQRNTCVRDKESGQWDTVVSCTWYAGTHRVITRNSLELQHEQSSVRKDTYWHNTQFVCLYYYYKNNEN